MKCRAESLGVDEIEEELHNGNMVAAKDAEIDIVLSGGLR